MRRAAVLALVAVLGSLSPAALAAGDPYRTASYKATSGDANIEGIAAPSVDITGVSYGYDGQYLRLTAKLAQASRNAPLPFLEADYQWRWKVGAVEMFVTYSRWTLPETNAAFSPYTVGASVKGADSPSSAVCASCYGTIDVAKGQAEFAITLDDLNALVDSVAASAPTVSKGTVLHPTEADTLVGFPAIGALFGVDSAKAPKGFSFTV